MGFSVDIDSLTKQPKVIDETFANEKPKDSIFTTDKQIVSNKDTIKTGERYKLTYKLPIINSPANIVKAIYAIKKHENFIIENYRIDFVKKELFIYVLVVKNFAITTAVIITAIAGAFSLFFINLILIKMERQLDKLKPSLFAVVLSVVAAVTFVRNL